MRDELGRIVEAKDLRPHPAPGPLVVAALRAEREQARRELHALKVAIAEALVASEPKAPPPAATGAEFRRLVGLARARLTDATAKPVRQWLSGVQPRPCGRANPARLCVAPCGIRISPTVVPNGLEPGGQAPGRGPWSGAQATDH